MLLLLQIKQETVCLHNYGHPSQLGDNDCEYRVGLHPSSIFSILHLDLCKRIESNY